MLKKILNPGNYSENVNYGLLFLRITIGLLMLTHGAGKLEQLFGNGPIQFADPVGLGPAVSLALSAFAEVFCSVLLILGFATRFAVIPLIINMTVAVLVIHADDLFRVKEMALLYLVVYVTIAIAGAGKISIDKLLYKKIRNGEPAGEIALNRR